MQTAPLWLTYLTFGVALVGAVLGVINTWKAIERDRVKLRVRCNWWWQPGSDTEGLTIVVTNLSTFPVTITNMSFRCGDQRHLLVIAPDRYIKGGGELPHRLESRTELMALFPATIYHDPRFANVRWAFVETACGIEVRCHSAALDKAVETARTAKQRAT